MDANEQYESLINPQEFLKKNRRNIKLVYDLLNQARNSGNDEIITNFINYIKSDGKWYYLEIQAFPAIEEWTVTQGIKKLKKGNIDDYINYLKLSLEARYAALMMCMQKTLYGTSEETKNHHLTLKPNK